MHPTPDPVASGVTLGRTMIKSATSCAVVLTMLMMGTGCSGSDDSADSDAASIDSTIDETSEESSDDEATSEASTDDSDASAAPGFGELIEGTYLLSGAEEEQYYSTDDELAFRMSGGCQGSAFGFGTNVENAAGTATFATFEVQGQQDLAGGVTGEFDDVDLTVTVFAEDMSASERYEGPVRMVISEHDTGGVDADLNARRMTVTLLGTVTGNEGDVDVDVTYRWVMGCP